MIPFEFLQYIRIHILAFSAINLCCVCICISDWECTTVECEYLLGEIIHFLMLHDIIFVCII